MHNCFTVDVEDWFHVCGVEGPLAREHWDALPSRVLPTTRALLALLDRCGVRATFFVLGWVADRWPHLVNEIRSAGHEIGSHGHLHRRAYELGREGFARDLDASVRSLRAAGVDEVRGFRAPEWSINGRSLWALEVLAERGFRFDSSMAPMRIVGDPGYPRVPHTRSTRSGALSEFPPLIGRRLGQNIPLGGGWGLRMSSPDTVLAGMEAYNRAGTPVTLFVHPWELDPDPPRVRLPIMKAFAHYFRLQGFGDRLERVLRGSTFAPIGDTLALASRLP